MTVYQQPVRELSGNARESGKPYHLRIQTAYAHIVDEAGNPLPVPEKFEVILEKDQQPFAPGDYTLHPSSLYLDRNGKLSLSPRLAPLRAKPATA
ncbi:single-stranded DNA-binding protein [Paucibacter sp. JuS9]|uniref:single-stranded DNA-binding protein n=1 Tax=Paucibacter sp. JuS9 TaxID=3228748 RepID=UPI0037583E36